MKRYIITLLLLSLVSVSMYSQDTLILMNGARMGTKVQSINDSVVKYKLNDKQFNSLVKLNKRIRNWSIGAGISSVLPYGEVMQYTKYPIGNYYSSRRVGFNIELNNSVCSFLDLQLQFTSGKLYGKKTNEVIDSNNRYFNTDFNDLSFNTVFNLNRIFISKEADESSRLRFYLKGGVGIIKYRSILKNTDSNNYISSFGYKNNGETYGTMLSSLVIPIGAGIRYRIGSNFYLRLEALMKYTNTDKLDAEVGDSKFDKYGMTSIALVFKPGRKRLTQDKVMDKTDVFSVKYANGETAITFVDTLKNKELIKNTGDYVDGEHYAMITYKPRIVTAGSIVSGLMGGYLAFYGMLVPTAYVIGASSMSPDIRDINGKLIIPESKADNIYFIQGYKDKARKKDVRNSILGGLAGLTTMIIIKSIHSSLK